MTKLEEAQDVIEELHSKYGYSYFHISALADISPYHITNIRKGEQVKDITVNKVYKTLAKKLVDLRQPGSSPTPQVTQENEPQETLVSGGTLTPTKPSETKPEEIFTLEYNVLGFTPEGYSIIKDLHTNMIYKLVAL